MDGKDSGRSEYPFYLDDYEIFKKPPGPNVTQIIPYSGWKPGNFYPAEGPVYHWIKMITDGLNVVMIFVDIEYVE